MYNVFFKALMEFRMELPTLHLITSYFYAEISPRTKPPINTAAQSHCSQCSCVVATLAFWWEIYHFFAEVTSSNVIQNTSGNVTGKVSTFEWFTYSFLRQIVTIHSAPAQTLVLHSAHIESASNAIVPHVCWAEQAGRDPEGHSAVLLDCSTSFPAAVKVWLLCTVTAWNFLQNPLNSENVQTHFSSWDV